MAAAPRTTRSLASNAARPAPKAAPRPGSSRDPRSDPQSSLDSDPVPVAAADALARPGDPLTIEQAQPLLRALADPIRLRVLQALAQGEQCVCELTAGLGLAQSKLSFHLRVMKEAGLISSRQQGRWIYYRLEPSVLLSLSGWLKGLLVCCETPAAPCR